MADVTETPRGNRDHRELSQTQGQEFQDWNPNETKTILSDITTYFPVNPWQSYHIIFGRGNHSGASAKVREIFFCWTRRYQKSRVLPC